MASESDPSNDYKNQENDDDDFICLILSSTYIYITKFSLCLIDMPCEYRPLKAYYRVILFFKYFIIWFFI